MDKPRTLFGLVRETGEVAAGTDARSGDIAQRRALDDILQSGDVHAGAPARAHPGSRFRGVRLCTGRLDDGEPSGFFRASPGQASPRDNVVFEAGLFGGVLGMRRTFILHAKGAKLPSDLLGLTCVRYAGRDDAVRDEGRQPENPEGNRERGSRYAHRGLVVAVLPDGAHRKGAVRAEPAEDFARSQRRARSDRPFMARGWKTVGAILERGGEGEGRVFRRLLLLER